MKRKYIIVSLSEKCFPNVVDVLSEFINTEAIFLEKFHGSIFTIDGQIWPRTWFVLKPINDYNLVLNYALKLSYKDKNKLLKELVKQKNTPSSDEV